jgi:hypothetical protein
MKANVDLDQVVCESQIVTVCQDIGDSLDEEARIDAIIIDFSKAVI